MRRLTHHQPLPSYPGMSGTSCTGTGEPEGNEAFQSRRMGLNNQDCPDIVNIGERWTGNDQVTDCPKEAMAVMAR